MSGSGLLWRVLVRVEYTSRAHFRSLWRKHKYDPLTSRTPDWAAPLQNSFDRLRSRPPAAPAAPQAEPHRLHAVCRVVPLKGRPYWEKNACRKLGLGDNVPNNKWTVHRNAHSVNEVLKAVKHLVRIVPITFPNGLPLSEDDLKYSLLKDNGQFTFVSTLTEAKSSADECDKEGATGAAAAQISGTTLKRHCRRILELRQLHVEHFPTTHRYELNQDGAEYRYSKDLPENRRPELQSVNHHLPLRRTWSHFAKTAAK